MRWRPTALSPWHRFVAGTALLLFIAAQALCFVHCHSGGGTGVGDGDSRPPCHGTVGMARNTGCPADRPVDDRPVNCPDNQGAPASMAAETCWTLKTMQSGDSPPSVVVPELHLIYLLAPLVYSLDSVAPAPAGANLRQARPADRVFTPALSLGPAFRALAPPFVG